MRRAFFYAWSTCHSAHTRYTEPLPGHPPTPAMSTATLPTPALSSLIADIEAIALANPDLDATSPAWPQALHDAIQAYGHTQYTLTHVEVREHNQDVALELDPGYHQADPVRLDIPFAILNANNVRQAVRIAQVEEQIRASTEQLVGLQRSILSVQDAIQQAHAELAELKATPAG